MTIDERNYEMWLYRYCEGLLDEAERRAVEAALAAHPDWQVLTERYDPTLRLERDTRLTMPDKERLLANGAVLAALPTTGGKRRRRAIALWVSTSAAACVLLAAGITLLRQPQHNEMAVATETELPVLQETTPAVSPLPSQPTAARPRVARQEKASAPPSANASFHDFYEEAAVQEAIEERVPAASETPAPMVAETPAKKGMTIVTTDQLINYLDEVPRTMPVAQVPRLRNLLQQLDSSADAELGEAQAYFAERLGVRKLKIEN